MNVDLQFAFGEVVMITLAKLLIPKGDAMRKMLSCSLAVLVLGLSLKADDKKEEKIDAKMLLGKWQAEKTDSKDPKEPTIVFEYKENGKLTMSFQFGDKPEKFDGTYKLDGNKINSESNGEKVTVTVLKLTATELKVKDSKRLETTFKKVK